MTFSIIRCRKAAVPPSVTLKTLLRSHHGSRRLLIRHRELVYQKTYSLPLLSTAIIYRNCSTFTKTGNDKQTAFRSATLAICCSIVVLFTLDYMFELRKFFKTDRQCLHPFAGLIVLTSDGGKEEADRNFLNQWFLFGIDHQSDAIVGGLNVDWLLEISAILSLEACTEAELIDCNGNMIVVPRENSGSDRKFFFQSAVLTDKLTVDIGKTSFKHRHMSELVVLYGSVDRLLRVSEEFSVQSDIQRLGEVDGENSRTMYYLINPDGNLVSRFSDNLSPELVSKEIALIIYS